MRLKDLKRFMLKGIGINKKIYYLNFLLFFLACSGSDSKVEQLPQNTTYDGTLKLGNSTGQKISPFLTGTNVVYSHEDMNTWQDGKKLSNLKQLGISAMRYPEGAVSFWDWEFPYHYAYENFWDPVYESTLTQTKKDQLMQDYKDRMLLNDFLNICLEADIEPIIGINMLQGWKYNRNEESIEKAVRLVEYCMNQSPNVKYFYLDNEAGHQLTLNNHIPIDEYINLIPAYSQAIKAVYPDAKLITNIVDWNQIEKMIRDTGQYWDILDIHWYYATDNIWAYFNLPNWRQEIKSTEIDNLVNNFQKWKQRYNMPHIEYGFLEWNAPPVNLTANSNPSTLNYLLMGLIQADMFMYMAKGGVNMASSWPLVWQPPNSDVDLNGYNRNLLDKDDSSWLTPSSIIFEAFSYIQNGEILENNYDNSSGLRILTVKLAQSKGYAILILNKAVDSEIIRIEFPDEASIISDAKTFKASSAQYDVQTVGISPAINNGKINLSVYGSSFTYILLE